MGSAESIDKEDSTDAEEVSEFLDSHPSFLQDYIDRNPHLLDNYVLEKGDEATVRKWLAKIAGPAPSDVLQTLSIDYLKEKNCASHNTDKYIHNSLVIRRAAIFDLDISFKSRAYLPAKDKIVLVFSTGEKPTVSNETKFRVPVKDSLQGSKWTCMLTKADDQTKKISVQINVPPDAIVGRYKLSVEVTTLLADGPKVKTTAKPDIIVLFNPFAAADEVYMEDEAKRAEYVLNDTGIIYFGQYYRIGGKHWLFGQFEGGILDVILKLLRADRNFKKNPVKMVKKRSSAVYCSRALSALVNCNDDKGVLYGRWDGEYTDGVRPTVWNGSVKIFEQWRDSNMDPVKYGQCWVFSGLLTTALRALGIPARSVTNFQSAHDTEFNMTIDKFIDKNGDELPTDDSIWNFHVWNEAWFKRADLPKGYDGWQAVDATPQEESNGVYQCGPAPVAAIRNGEIYIGSDANFLFAEVNADRLTWEVNDSGDVVALRKREERHVGKNISTKAVGSDEREDITLEYKFREGSDQERTAFDRAYAHGRKASYHELFHVIEDEGAVTIDIKVVGEAINGQTINFKVEVKNTTKDAKTAMISTVIATMLHNDVRKTFLRRSKNESAIAAGKTNTLTFELPFADYGRHLSDNNVIRVSTTVRVKETDKLYVDSHDAVVQSPDCITIECADTLTYREYNDVKFKIVNPLPVTLTAGVFTLEGSGVTTGKTLKLTDTIAPNATYTSPAIEVRPYRKGATSTLIADFDCNEIMNVKARKRVQISA